MQFVGDATFLCRTLFFAAFSCAILALSLGTATAADPAISYNEGVDLYRAEKFDQAADKFRLAATADTTSLAAKARYNLGNTHYARAVAGLRSQPAAPRSEVIDHLRSAITHYNSSLRLTPEDVDAQTNVELANRLIQRLEEEQKKPEDQNPESEPQQKNQADQADQADQNDQGNQGQENGEPPNGEPQEGEPQQGESQEGEPQEGEPQEGEPQEGEPQDESESNQTDQQASDAGDRTQQHNGDPERNSPENSDQPPSDERPDDGSQPAEPEKTQHGELETDNASANSSANRGDGKPAHAAVESADQMTHQEAEKLLQMIRDRDMLRRMQRTAERRARRVPVPQDW